MPTKSDPNVFLDGNYAPLDKEYTIHKPQIRGSIPKVLNGWFIRNGPNPHFKPLEPYHWFHGDGMIHSFLFSKGDVQYKNRFIRTPIWLYENRAGMAIFGKWLNNIPAIFKVLKINPFRFIWEIALKRNFDLISEKLSPANTALMYFRDKLYALCEIGPPIEIDKHTLETQGDNPFTSGFHMPFTAHPKTDNRSGYMFSFGYRYLKKSWLQYYVINPQGKLIKNIPIKTPYPAMLHDFAVTAEFVVFPIFPAIVSRKEIRRGHYAVWQPQKGASIGYMNRMGNAKDIRWISLDPFYVYHFLNSYNENDKIVIDGIKHDTLPFFNENNENSAADISLGGYLTRWTIETSTGDIFEENLDRKTCAEYPVIDSRFSMQKHSVAFAATDRQSSQNSMGRAASGREKALKKEHFNTIVRWDFLKNNVKTGFHEFFSKQFCSEPIFVPKSKTSSEGDGYILTLVYDTNADTSSLVILDAAHLERKPLAEVILPHRIPYGFHGLWISR